jgi:hypothetical protein
MAGIFGKKGMEKEYIIGGIIIVIIVAMAFFWIFKSFVFAQEIDWQTCRESVILRAGDANSDAVKAAQEQLVPFKCKTQVLKIDYQNVSKAMNEIATILARCWYTYGEGKLLIYEDRFRDPRMQFICARIYFDNRVVKFYKDNFHGTNFRKYLSDGKMPSGISFSEYIFGQSYDPILANQYSGNDNFNDLNVISDIDAEKDMYISYIYIAGAKPSAGIALDYNPNLKKITEVATIPA